MPIDKSKLSSEVIPGITEVYANYGRVLPAGVYTVNVADTDHVKLTTGRNKKGKPYTAISGLTLRVIGDADGKEEGVQVGSMLRFQKSWIETIVNAVFNKKQIAKGEGIPITEEAQADFIDGLATQKIALKVKVDWTAFDSEKYNDTLVELADTKDREDPVAMAKQAADAKMRAAASKAATLATTYSDFPLNEETGEYIGSFDTPNGEIRAQANVVRYFLAEGN